LIILPKGHAMKRNIQKPDPLSNLKDVPAKVVAADRAAFKKNQAATNRNQKKDNAPGTAFDNPDQIGHPEPPRNDGDQGGAD